MKNHFKKIDAKNESALFQALDKKLETKKAFGQSRNKDKQDGSDKNKIYSYNTYFAYRSVAYSFAKFVEEKDPTIRHLNQARSYIDDFLKSYQDQDASA